MAAAATAVQPQTSGDWSTGIGLIPGRALFGPISLMITTPCFSIIFFHVCANMKGNFVEYARICMENGFVDTLRSVWPDPWDPAVWTMIFSFLAFEAMLMRVVPGKRFEASLTAKGNLPVYTANGTACYLITLVTILVLGATGLFDPALIYDNYGKILSSLNVFAWAFCTMLWIKGYVAPSTSDSGTTGNIIMDFFWGMELYPNVFGWDVKMFINCRSGMMFWAVAVLSFAFKNKQIQADGQVQYGMIVSVVLQLIYITKFFHWEMGYMCSMDIQHDRAGYYTTWGCLVWVPAVYTSTAFFLTTNAPDIAFPVALGFFLSGVACIWINYDSDRQRYVFRQTQGRSLIWGRIPNKIVATYTTKGSTTPKQSLLLVDGYWKISRHFHYVPEIMASFFWSVSALNHGFVGPYFYVIYLTILLTDRAFRDDDRCRKKYGKYWDEYCAQVPFKIVPGLV